MYVTLFAKTILKYSWCQQKKYNLPWARYRKKGQYWSQKYDFC